MAALLWDQLFVYFQTLLEPWWLTRWTPTIWWRIIRGSRNRGNKWLRRSVACYTPAAAAARNGSGCRSLSPSKGALSASRRPSVFVAPATGIMAPICFFCYNNIFCLGSLAGITIYGWSSYMSESKINNCCIQVLDPDPRVTNGSCI